jgi:hypothetical protein
MADLVLNPQTGLYEFRESDQEENLGDGGMTLGPIGGQPAPPPDPAGALAQDFVQQQITGNRKAPEILPADWGKELQNIGGNVLTGFVTDFMDLGAMVGDIGRASVGGMSWNEVGNDSDNPWTTWRRNTFKVESQAGKFINTFARFGSLAYPSNFLKLGVRALMGAAKLGTTVTRTRGLARGAVGLAGRGLEGVGGLRAASGLDDLLTPLKRVRDFGKTTAFTDRFSKADDIIKARTGSGMKFLERGARVDEQYMAVALDDLIKRAPDADFMTRWVRGVEAQTRAIWKLPAQQKIRTLGDLVVRDAFATFMLAGEGDDAFDDAAGAEFVAGLNIPGVSGFARTLIPEFQDSPLAVKGKMMAEGMFMGAAFMPIIDGFRLSLMARRFVRGTEAEKQMIRTALATPNVAPDFAKAALNLPSEVRPFGTKALQELVQNARQANKVGAQANRAMDNAAYQAWLAQNSTVRGDELQGARSLTMGEVADSPVQQRLAAMEGQTVPQMAGGDDPTYREWLATRASTAVEGATPPAGPAPQSNARELATFEVIGSDAQRALWRKEDNPPPLGLTMGERELPQVDARDPEPQFQVRYVPVEPVVAPDTIRAAVKQDLAELSNAGQSLTDDDLLRGVEEIKARVVNLLPPSRSGMVDYVLGFPVKANRNGLLDGVDSMWRDQITRRGLLDGFAQVDEDFGAFTFNRSKANEIDAAEAIDVVAVTVDDAARVQRAVEPPAIKPQPQPQGQADGPAAQGAETPPVDPAQLAAQADATGGIQGAINQGDELIQKEAARLPDAQPVDLVQELEALTVKQLQERGAGLGMRAAEMKGRKADLVQKIAAREESQKSLQESTDSIIGPGMRMGQMAAEASEGSITRELGGMGATAAFKDADRYGEILGQGLNRLDEPTGGQLRGAAEAVPPPAATAIDEATAARLIDEASFRPATVAQTPKYTDEVQIRLKLTGDTQVEMMRLITGDGKINGTTGVTMGAKTMDETAEILEMMIKEGEVTGRDKKAVTMILTKIRKALGENGEQIDTAAKIKGLAREAVNDLTGKLNCDLTEML